MAVVRKLPQESDVAGIDVVLLVAGRLPPDGEVVAPMLPSEIVVVIEGIVGKDLRVGVGADVAGAVPRLCPGKAYKKLSAKRYADCFVAGEAERPDGSVGTPLFQRTRVKPKRASLMIEGEKVWTQLTPAIFVG